MTSAPTQVVSTSAAAASQAVSLPVDWEAAVGLVRRGAGLRRRRWRLHLGAAFVLGVGAAIALSWSSWVWFTVPFVAVTSTVSALLLLIPARVAVSIIDRAMIAALCRDEGCRVDVIAAATRLTAQGMVPAAALTKAIKTHGGLRLEHPDGLRSA